MIKAFTASLGLFTRAQRFYFWLLVCLRILTNLLDVAGLIALGFLASALMGGLSSSGPQESVLGKLHLDDLNLAVSDIALAVVSLFVVKSVASSLLLRSISRFLASVEAKGAERISEQLFSGPFEFLRSMSPGKLQFLVGASTHAALASVPYAGAGILTEASLLIAVFATFLFLDPKTTLFVGAYFVVIVALYQLGINQRLRRLGERLQESSIDVANSIYNTLSAVKELRVLNRTRHYIDKIEVARSRLAHDEGLQRFVAQLPRYYVEAGLMLGVGGLLLSQLLGTSVGEGAATIGVFLAGGVRLMAAILPLQNAVAEMKYAIPQALDAQSHLRLNNHSPSNTGARVSNIRGPQSTVALEASKGCHIVADQLSFRYQNGDTDVLKKVSLEIPSGSTVAFIGPSGSGKSTLVDVILGLLEPTAGSVTIDGLEPQSFCQQFPGSVSYVPQKPGMVSGTIAENVALGLGHFEREESRVLRALDDAQLSDYVKALPMGLSTKLGPQANNLSGGQVQRIGLARALYSSPRLLILDEATSALDAETEANMVSNLRALPGNVTKIVVAHRLSSIQDSDIVFAFFDGEIEAQGTFSEVRSASPRIDNYVRLMQVD